MMNRWIALSLSAALVAAFGCGDSKLRPRSSASYGRYAERIRFLFGGGLASPDQIRTEQEFTKALLAQPWVVEDDPETVITFRAIPKEGRSFTFEMNPSWALVGQHFPHFIRGKTQTIETRSVSSLDGVAICPNRAWRYQFRFQGAKKESGQPIFDEMTLFLDQIQLSGRVTTHEFLLKPISVVEEEERARRQKKTQTESKESTEEDID